MADGRQRSEWGRLSVWLAMFGNANRDPKKGRPFKPDDFNPFAEKKAVNAPKPTPDQQVSMFALALRARKQE